MLTEVTAKSCARCKQTLPLTDFYPHRRMKSGSVMATASTTTEVSGASAHTPGPWFVFDHYCGRDPATAGEEYAATRLIGMGQFDTIAEVRMGHDDLVGDVDANARLIAAAPELLEALLEILGQLNVCSDNPNVRDDVCLPIDMTMGELRKAKSAIAKAAGAA